MSKPRDVVVVRVSEKGDREDEHFHSPEVQIEAATRWAKDRGERLVASPIPEIDVSGKLPLSKRPGLLAAIEMIEAGQVDQLVVAYFDRLVRSLKVQLEVIERVERAGGEMFALDHGKLTNGTAAQRLSTNMLGSVFQYFAEITGEKVAAAQGRAVARGVYPHPKIPVGYVRGENGVLVVEPAAAKVVVQAFKRRDRGASLVEIQALLAENGIKRALSGVAWMLRSRMYLGEIHFGELHNLNAHEAIIKDRALFDRVQRRRVSRGRQAKSERLLARLGVLRCGTCGSRMVINSDSGSYRCGDTSANRCRRRAAVKADRVEAMVLDGVRAYSATADAPPRALQREQIREADEAIERANADLDDTIRQLGELGLLGRPASQETLEKLTTALDDTHAARARLGHRGERNVIGPDDIDKLSDPANRLAAWRRLIANTVESVTVSPAMTPDGRPSRLWGPLAGSTSGSSANIHKTAASSDLSRFGPHPSGRPTAQLSRPSRSRKSRRLYGAHNSWIAGGSRPRGRRLPQPWHWDRGRRRRRSSGPSPKESRLDRLAARRKRLLARCAVSARCR
jgi:DNA invertase Pin-like site-specific DNA recombinase